MIEPVDALLDHDILLYAAMGREDHPEYFEIACGLLTSSFGIAIPSLQCFISEATTKGKRPLTQDEISQWVVLLLKKPVQPLDEKIIKQALITQEQISLCLHEAILVESAKRLNANKIYSSLIKEEMKREIKAVKGIEIINPFMTSSQ